MMRDYDLSMIILLIVSIGFVVFYVFRNINELSKNKKEFINPIIVGCSVLVIITIINSIFYQNWKIVLPGKVQSFKKAQCTKRI
jgi:glucan phosphoethanolaminetransferase (alkaline phosphatase superfamily)